MQLGSGFWDPIPERVPAPYLAADAGCDVSHLDPVELSDVQVLAVERLYLDFHTWKASRVTVGESGRRLSGSPEQRAAGWWRGGCTDDGALR